MSRRVILEDAVCVGVDATAAPPPLNVEAALCAACEAGELLEMEHGFARLAEQGECAWTYALEPPAGAVGFTNLTVLFRGDAGTGILSHVKYGALVLNGRVVDVLCMPDCTDDVRVAEFVGFAAPRMFPLRALAASDELRVVVAFKTPPAQPASSVRVLVDIVCDVDVPHSVLAPPWSLPLPRMGATATLECTAQVDGGEGGGGRGAVLRAVDCPALLLPTLLPPLPLLPLLPAVVGEEFEPRFAATDGWPHDMADAEEDEAAVARGAEARAIVQREVDAQVEAGVIHLGSELVDDVGVEFAMRTGETLADKLDEIVAWAAQRQLLRLQLAKAQAAATDAGAAAAAVSGKN